MTCRILETKAHQQQGLGVGDPLWFNSKLLRKFGGFGNLFEADFAGEECPEAGVLPFNLHPFLSGRRAWRLEHEESAAFTRGEARRASLGVHFPKAGAPSWRA